MKEIRGNGWFQRESKEVSQTSYFRIEESDAQLGLNSE